METQRFLAYFILLLCLNIYLPEAKSMDHSDHKVKRSVNGAINEPIECGSVKVLCQSGNKCIWNSQLCNGNNDCEDGSDEVEAFCAEQCDGFWCSAEKTCVPNVWVCDFNKNCVDGSDEDPEMCKNHTCVGFEKEKCEESGYCYQWYMICNGVDECPKGDDERDCDKPCYNRNFMCGSGRCIDRALVCNRIYDCWDRSDEKNCDEKNLPPCPENTFECPNHQCIHPSYLCDGTDHCDDFTDEMNCSYGVCTDEQFRCGYGKCISKELRCDRAYNCIDRSDEQNCTYEGIPCPGTGWECDNEKCIYPHWKCDGHDDCGDGSDERNCGSVTSQETIRRLLDELLSDF